MTDGFERVDKPSDAVCEALVPHVWMMFAGGKHRTGELRRL